MDKIKCPHCNGDVLNDERMAGQVVGCPNCQQPFRMPAAVPANELMQLQSQEPAPAAMSKGKSSVQPVQPRAAPAPAPAPEWAAAAREPWYYGFLERYARILVFLGVAVAALVLMLLLFMTILTVMNAETLTSGIALNNIAVLVVGVFGIVLFLTLIVFSVALVHLAVDAGRNIRAIRRNTDK